MLGGELCQSSHFFRKGSVISFGEKHAGEEPYLLAGALELERDRSGLHIGGHRILDNLVLNAVQGQSLEHLVAKLAGDNLVENGNFRFVAGEVVDELAAIIIAADIDAHGIAQLLKKPLNNWIIGASKHTVVHKPMPLIGCDK